MSTLTLVAIIDPQLFRPFHSFSEVPQKPQRPTCGDIAQQQISGADATACEAEMSGHRIQQVLRHGASKPWEFESQLSLQDVISHDFGGLASTKMENVAVFGSFNPKRTQL